MANDKALIKRQVMRIIRTGSRTVAGTKRILPAAPEILYSETTLLKRLTVPELHALADVMEFLISRAGRTDGK